MQNERMYQTLNVTSQLVVGILVLTLLGCSKNETKLLVAVRDGKADAVKSLLDAGADINYTVTDGISAIHIAAIQGHHVLSSSEEILPTRKITQIHRGLAECRFEVSRPCQWRDSAAME